MWKRFFFFFKQKTAYEIGTGDWSSDVCSSDLNVKLMYIATPTFIRTKRFIMHATQLLKSRTLQQEGAVQVLDLNF